MKPRCLARVFVAFDLNGQGDVSVVWQVFEAYAGFAIAVALSITLVPAMLGLPVDDAVGLGTRTLVWMLGVPGAVVLALQLRNPEGIRDWFDNGE